MSYKVKEIEDKYCVVENDALTIRCYSEKQEANDICRGLNLGKGFNGHTPIFMTRDIFIQE